MTTKDTDKFLIPGLQITEVLTSELDIFLNNRDNL